MGKNRGRRGEGHLADMAQVPPPNPDYVPPPEWDCDPLEIYPLVLSQTERIAGKAHMYRNRVVNFAITSQVRGDAPEVWHDVTRIDCCHNHVHRHQFHKSGNPERLTSIKTIPTGGTDEESWEVVDTEYDPATDLLTNSFAEHHRVWRTG